MFTNVFNELMKNDTYKNAVDADENGEISDEEMLNFLNMIAYSSSVPLKMSICSKTVRIISADRSYTNGDKSTNTFDTSNIILESFL